MTSPGYYLSVGNVHLFRGVYPDNEVLSVFREDDRQDSPKDTQRYVYQCAVGQLCDRLDVMGFRLADAQHAMRQFVQELISVDLKYHIGVRDPAEQHRRTTAENVAVDLLKRGTFEQWRDTYTKLVSEWHSMGELGTSQRGPFERYLYEFRSAERDAPVAGIRSPFGSVRLRLRAMLSAFEIDAEVRLDCSRLIPESWIAPSERLTEAAIEQLLAPARATEPTIVLTEGASDTRLLSRSLERLFPHLRGFYTFLDHEGFLPPSGTGNIANLVKGLAASGISNRVIALFDNDSAGTVAADDARRRRYPGNFRILQLPTLERGKGYPTLGPTGAVSMDINGKACSLELYLGNAALSDKNGAPVPILWTGYERKLRQYQGELSCKLQVQKRYLERLEKSEVVSTDPEFDDMRMVLRAIMYAFAT